MFLTCEGVRSCLCQGCPNSSWVVLPKSWCDAAAASRKVLTPVHAEQQVLNSLSQCIQDRHFSNLATVRRQQGEDIPHGLSQHVPPPRGSKAREIRQPRLIFSPGKLCIARHLVILIQWEKTETDREHEICASFLEHDSSQTAYCKRLVTFCVEPGKTLGSLRYLLLQELLLSFNTQTSYELLRGLRKSCSQAFSQRLNY